MVQALDALHNVDGQNEKKILFRLEYFKKRQQGHSKECTPAADDSNYSLNSLYFLKAQASQ